MMDRVFFIDIMFEQHTLHGDPGAWRQPAPRVGEGGKSTEAPGDDNFFFFIDIMFEQHTLHGDSGAWRQTPPRVREGGESTEAPGDDG